MLVGHFAYVYDSDTYRTGEIIEQVSSDHYLVQFDDMSGGNMRMPLELVGAAEMALLDHIGRRWSFFPSRERLQKFLDWLETPSEPRMKIVRSIKRPFHALTGKSTH
jgi:hypothetical protein